MIPSDDCPIPEHMSLNHLLIQFAYLQVLDLMTTIAFLVNGVQEGNPFVRLVIDWSPDPFSGLILVKLLAVSLGLYCWRRGRGRVLSRINAVFALVVAWNLAALILRSGGRA